MKAASSRPRPRFILPLSGAKYIGAAAAALTLLTGRIQAANINWTGVNGDLLWATPTNWAGDVLPSPTDIAVMNLNAAQTISLGGSTQTIQGILFNQAQAYALSNGAFVLSQLNQTGNVNNQIQSSVTITTPNGGLDLLSANITANTLQVQGKITSGGLTKTGSGLLRLGTSGTNFENAINGAVDLNGGTLQVAAGSTAGVNNPLGGTGVGSDLINIGASGVTLQLTAQTHYDFVRQVVANDNSFTLRGDPATGDPGDFQMTIGKITIGNATLTTTTGSGYQLRAAELALNAGATTTLQINNILYANSLSGDATTKLIKNGGSDLRIVGNATNATSFAGDIDHNQGWLVLESSGATAQPLGHTDTRITITNAVNNPVVSMRAEASRTFDGINIDAGNNNFQLDARNLSGSTNGFVMTGGSVTMGNATMNVIGDRAQARLATFTINPGATLTTINTNSFSQAAQHLRVDVLTGDANSTLRKSGSQALFIGASDATFAGKLEVNGGTVVIEGSPGLNPIRDIAGPITFTSGSTVSLRATASMDFGDNVDFAFAPEVLSSTIEVRRNSGSATGQVIGLGDIHITGTGNRVLTLNSGESYTATADAIRVGSGTTLSFFGNASITTPILDIPANATLLKHGGGTLTLNTDNTATALGAIALRTGTITGTVAGSLSSGGIVVGNPVPNSAGFLVDFSRLNYNAVNASAATATDATALALGVIDLNVTPALDDVFAVQAGGRIQGNSTQLGALTVGGNLSLAADAIVVHETPGASTITVQGLVADMGLYYGLANTANTLPTLGAGTPWKGLSADNSGRTVNGANTSTPAVLSVNGGDDEVSSFEVFVQAMSDQTLSLGTTSTTDGQFQWASTAPGGERVTVQITGSMGQSLGFARGGRVAFNEAASVSGIAAAVDKIVIDGSALVLAVPESLGGVPVEVRAGGTLDIISASTNLIDGDVNVKSGGALYLNDNQTLAGTGEISIDDGGILDITGAAPANILTQSQLNGQAINFSGVGHTVRFTAENVEELDLRVPDSGANFVIAGGNATTVNNFGSSTLTGLSVNAQTAGLSTDGGFITNDGSSRGLNAPLTIGPNGATFAATRNTSFVIGSAVSTTGDIQIGSNTAIDGRDKSYNFTAVNSLGQPDPYSGGTTQVIFGNSFSAANVVIENSNAIFTSGDTNISGSLIANGGVLYLDGGGNNGGTQGELTEKIKTGTMAPGGITIGNFTRLEMKLNLPSDGSRTDINQAFVVEGGANPGDNRRIYVSRNSGSATGVNFTDITLKAGAALAFDEDNTDVRATLKLAGNATTYTGAHDVMDFGSVTRASSLPAYTGSNPVVLTHGRVNELGAQGFNTGQTNVFGEIGAGVEINLVRGGLHFTPTSVINGVIRAHTAPLGGDAYIISSSNNGSNTFNTATTVGGTGHIELGFSAAANGPEEFEIRGTEVTNATAAEAPLHTHEGQIRIVNDGVNDNLDGIIRSNRVNDSDRVARVQVNDVRIGAGAGLQFASLNGISLMVDALTMAGNATIDAAGPVTINTVNAAPAGVVNFTGAIAPTIGSAISTGTINVTNANFAGAVNTTGSVNVHDGDVSFADSVTSGVTVTKASATFNPGVGNTRIVGGDIALDNGGILSVASGTIEMGSKLITSSSSSAIYIAGLREDLLAGSFNVADPNLSSTVRLGPIQAQMAAGWPINSTFVYTGQVFVPDNGAAGDGMGSIAFAESFDDSVRIDIDGVQRLSNGAWNDATGTGELVLSAGWHEVEFRFGQGSGGVGPVAQDGWSGQLGIGIDLTPGFDSAIPTTNPVQSQYVAPLDDGSMNLFRVSARNTLALAANATINAGGFTNLGALQFEGSNSRVTLNGSGPVIASTTASTEVAAGAFASVTVQRAGDSVSLGTLTLNGSLSLEGSGDFIVTGAGSGSGGLTKDGPGALTVNGSVTGITGVIGGTLRGNAEFETLLVDQAIIAPGNSAGIITAASLTASNSTFLFEIGSGATAGLATAGVHYDQFHLTGSVFDLGDAALELAVASPLQEGDVFTLILNSGSAVIQSFFAGHANGSTIDLPNGYEVQISYFDDASTAGFELSGGDDVSLLVTVPEPSSVMMLLGGLGIHDGDAPPVSPELKSA